MNSSNFSSFQEIPECYRDRIVIDKHSNVYVAIIIVCIFTICSNIISFIGNGLVLFAVSRNRSLQTNCNLLLCFLCSTDFTISFTVQPFFLSEQIAATDGSFSCLISELSKLLEYVLVGLSLWTVALIACDRHIAIHMPFYYISVVTKTRLCAITVIVWLAWIGLIVLFLTIPGGAKYLSYLGITTIIFLLVLVLFIYNKIFKITRSHQVRIAAHEQSSNTEETTRIAKEKRIALTMLMIASSLFVCYTPTMLLLLIEKTTVIEPVTRMILWAWFETLLLANSSVNCFIYSWRCSDIRQAVVCGFKQCFGLQ